MMASEEINISNKLLDNLSSAAELTHDAISDFLITIKENCTDDLVMKCCQDFMKLSSDYVNAIEDMSSLFKVNLKWLPSSYPITPGDVTNTNQFTANSLEIIMNYADGSTPWSFWLSYSKSSLEYEALLLMINDELKSGNLCRVNSLPEIGTSVICVDRSSVFRAIVLNNYADKVRVRNIDDTYVKVIKLENVYVMMRKMSILHAQTVQCCLTKEKSNKKLWSSDLCSLFMNTMKECQLKVKFLEEFSDEFPPIYLVEMQGHGESTFSFNEWICIKMFSELLNYQRIEDVRLENLPESILDPYYKDDKNRFNKNKSFSHNENTLVKLNTSMQSIPSEQPPKQISWSPQLFIPQNPMMTSYFLPPSVSDITPSMHSIPQILHTTVPAIATQYTTTTLYADLDRNAEYPVPRQVTATSSFIVNQAVNSIRTLNIQSPVFVPSVKRVEASEGELSEEQVKSSQIPVNIIPECEICPTYSKNGFCLKPSCNKKHIQIKNGSTSSEENSSNKSDQGVEDIKSHGMRFISNTSANANRPEVSNILLDSEQNDNCEERKDELFNDEDDDDMDEEPIVNGSGYMPTDESRICRFFSKNGKCWKPYCTKEHSMTVKNKWTNDTQDAVQSVFNLLDLPIEGETIELLVMTVRSPLSFYARLPDIYSDIGEHVKHIETFRTLHRALNDPKNVKKYISPQGTIAGDSELYSVLASDNVWKRARVLECNEKNILVFYVDYGQEEYVSRKVLKNIEEKFLHLPCQAVLCTLYDLYCSLDDGELRFLGKKHLDELIRGKVISGKIIGRNVEESSLDLVVIYNGLNINNMMLAKGFCEQL